MTLLLALLACTPKEEAGPSLTASPTSVDVGTVSVGDAATATVVLQNVGGGTVEILSASLVDGDSRAWAVSREGFDPLEGSVQTTLTITFSPDAEGASPAELQVRSTDPTNPSLYIPLDGAGGPSTADNDGDGHSPADGDCNDGNPEIYPGASEICDGADSDCDGVTPEDEADADRDGWHLCDDDCDDGDAAVYPGAEEICDDKDSDCDGTTPDRNDGDGDGQSICDGDCDDGEDAVFTGATELCDGLDNDCSGEEDDLDFDGDGASLCGDVPDCDDEDPLAYPVYVDAAAADGGTGTSIAPFASLADALAALDDTCRTVGIFPGNYEASHTWSSGEVALVGLAGDPSGVTLTPPADSRTFLVSGGAALTLENLTLSGASNPDGDGGAIFVSNADLTLRKVIAMLNSTAADGGAVAVTSGTLTLEDGCVLSSNTAGDDGGAVALVSSTFLDYGTAYNGNQAIQGGAVFAVSSSVMFDGSTFESNAATADGGGAALDAVSSFWAEHLVFVDNDAGARGGGLSVNDLGDDESVLRGSRFLGNTAGEGGGLALTGSVAAGVVANNTFVGNLTTDGGAGAWVDVTSAGSLYFASNIVAWNDGASGLGVASGAAPVVAYNLGYATSSGVDFDAPDGEVESLVEDPLFTDFSDDGDTSDDDLTLGPRSPAIGSGPDSSFGPAFYQSEWMDVDGTENDRGYTGGQGGW
jgi:hypothetical protein